MINMKILNKRGVFMRTEKNIYFFNKKEEISIVYTNDNFNAGECKVEIYNKYKISILLSDGINAVINNSIIGGAKYNILFFRPDEIHFGSFAKNGGYTWLDIFVPVTFFGRFTNNSGIIHFLTDRKTDRINCLYFDANSQLIVHKLSQNIVSLIKNNNGNEFNLLSLILQTVVLCNDFYEREKSNYINCNIPIFVQKAVYYISKNYDKKLSVNEIAVISGCSVAYLTALFKKYMNMTIYNYITAIRILNAQKFLKEGKSVTETSFLCGFNDCSNFANKFKKITGQIPSSFKNL